MEITRDFITAILAQIEDLVRRNISNIDEAYQESGEEYEDGTKSDRVVKIGITSQISEAGPKYEIETSISFVKSKVKEKIKVTIGPEQLLLFDRLNALTPKKGSGVDSVTFEAGEKKVTLHAK